MEVKEGVERSNGAPEQDLSLAKGVSK
uniref:Uncharacterized protein n=1 Tax=Arundo donax TaxID=35708 RepID=A0A0A9BN81_ARUDO